MSTNQTNRTAELDEFKLYTLTELEGVLGVSHRTLLTYVKHQCFLFFHVFLTSFMSRIPPVSSSDGRAPIADIVSRCCG